MQVHVLEEKKNKFNAAVSTFVNAYSAAHTQKSADFPAAAGPVPSKPHVSTSGAFGPQLPSPRSRLLLPASSNVPSHRLPANLEIKHETASSVKFLLWSRHPEPQSPSNTGLEKWESFCPTCDSARLPHHLPHRPTALHLRHSPSHCSPSFSKVKFNYLGYLTLKSIQKV